MLMAFDQLLLNGLRGVYQALLKSINQDHVYTAVLVALIFKQGNLIFVNPISFVGAVA